MPNASLASYDVQCVFQENGIAAISRPDRKELLAYLTGQTSTAERIDRNAPLEIAMQRPLQGTVPIEARTRIIESIFVLLSQQASGGRSSIGRGEDRTRRRR